ncbi:MAG: hypothetical protein Q9202_000480 [Teloschistes flavicans]
MRIATLQFAPQLGRVDENIARADSLLVSSATPLNHLDLLVLPELAFTGPDRANYYKVTAYNSTVTVDNEGRVVAHYRKRFLWYADEVWAQEGGEGFETAKLEYPLRDPPLSTATMDTKIISKHGSTNGGEPDPQLSSTPPPAPPQQPPRTTDDKMTKHTTTFAICMDLNTHHFSPPPPSAPLEATHPLASHILSSSTTLLVLSTAWLTNLPAFALRSQPEEPDWDTLACWIERLSPLLDSPENMDPEEGGEGEVRRGGWEAAV